MSGLRCNGFIPANGGNFTITNNTAYKTSTADAVRQVQKALPQADHLRRKPWRGAPHPYKGHCYVACEVVKHLSNDDLRPAWVKHEGVTHWFLRGGWGEIIDPTASQFRQPPPYEAGRGCGFLTKQPSRRARTLLAIIDQQMAAAYIVNNTYNMTFTINSPTAYAAITGLGY